MNTSPTETLLDEPSLIREGQRLHRQNQPDEALKVFTGLLRRSPENATAWNNLAVICSDQGDQKAAKALLEIALWLEPLNRRALVNFVNLLMLGGEFIRARFWLRSYLDRQVETDPELQQLLTHCNGAVDRARGAYGRSNENLNANSLRQVLEHLMAARTHCEDWPVFTPIFGQQYERFGDHELFKKLLNLVRPAVIQEAVALERDRALEDWGAMPSATPQPALEWPEEIDIEILTVCNIRCRNCYQQQIHHKRKPMMSWADFVRLMERLQPLLAHARGVGFNSVEALIHRDLERMIGWIRTRYSHLSLPLYTNGMLFTPERIRPLVDQQVNNYIISLDGARKETVETFKTGVNFAQVVGNIRAVQAAFPGRLHLSTNFVACRSNLPELLEYVDLCRDLGIQQILVSGFIAYDPEVKDQCLYSEFGMPEVEVLFQQAARRATEAGMVLRHHTTKLREGICHVTRSMHIDIEGNLVPCNLLGEQIRTVLGEVINLPERVVWGNVFQEDPVALWNGVASRSFRQTVNDGRLPKACGRCPIGHGVICG